MPRPTVCRTLLGLPPRARGSPRRARLTGRARRPTPACAGITPFENMTEAVKIAYPRVRGDHTVPGDVPGGHHGLPPRARGSRCARHLSKDGEAYPRVRGDHAGHQRLP